MSDGAGTANSPVERPPARSPLGRRVHLLGHLWDIAVTIIIGCWFLWIVAMAPGTLGTAVFLLLLILATSLCLRWAWWRVVTSRREHNYEVQPPLYWLRGKAE